MAAVGRRLGPRPGRSREGRDQGWPAGEEKCLDLDILEAEGTRVIDVPDRRGQGGVSDTLRLGPSAEGMVGSLPETGRLGEMTSGTNGPTLAVCLWCLVGPMCLGWDGQAPDGTMGFAGEEWPLVSGPGWGPPGRGRQGAWAKPLTPNFCARGRAHPRSFCSSWKPGPNRKVQMWSWTRSRDRAVWGGPAARRPVGQASVWPRWPPPSRVWGAGRLQL